MWACLQLVVPIVPGVCGGGGAGGGHGRKRVELVHGGHDRNHNWWLGGTYSPNSTTMPMAGHPPSLLNPCPSGITLFLHQNSAAAVGGAAPNTHGD